MSKEPQDTEIWEEFGSGESCPGAFLRRMTAVFNTEDVYGAIGVEIYATAQQIKKRIHRMTLELHPDKHKLEGADKEKAKGKFLLVMDIKALLLNEAPRGLYDNHGES